MKRTEHYRRLPMPKASDAGTERLAEWCRKNVGVNLTHDQAKELLERAVRLFYLAHLSDSGGGVAGRKGESSAPGAVPAHSPQRNAGSPR